MEILKQGIFKMNEIKELKRGDIVQLHPERCKQSVFKGCLMIVTDPKSFGAQGYIQEIGERGEMGGVAFYRATWEEMELCGKAMWILTGL